MPTIRIPAPSPARALERATDVLDPLGAGTVVGTVSGAVGGGAVVWEPTPVLGVVVFTPPGPTTPSAATSPRGCCGVGSNETQPARWPRYTCGHACASAPRTVT